MCVSPALFTLLSLILLSSLIQDKEDLATRINTACNTVLREHFWIFCTKLGICIRDPINKLPYCGCGCGLFSSFHIDQKLKEKFLI